jgi:hypothetical protein
MRDFVIENKIARLGEDSGAQRAGDSFSDGFYRRKEETKEDKDYREHHLDNKSTRISDI